MRALLKLLLFAVVSMIVARLAALVVSRQFGEGREVSDEFRRLSVMDWLEFSSRAGGLRSGEVSVVMGGAMVDLRETVLDPAGAELLTECTMSGLAVLVRSDWAVTVDETLVGGGESRSDVTSPDDLPEDAPKLHIKAITRLGATVVTTDDGDL